MPTRWAAATPLAVLPFEAGHGWSFALAYSCMSLASDEFAAAGLQATVVGVLIEVPVMLSVVRIFNATKPWYERGLI